MFEEPQASPYNRLPANGLMAVDYLKSGNTFCDSRDLKDHGEISYQLLICFTLLFHFKISHTLIIEMMNMMLESNDDEVTNGDDVDHKDNITYIDISLIFDAVFVTLMSDEKHISRAH